MVLIEGTSGNDTLLGTGGSDLIDGGNGNDLLIGTPEGALPPITDAGFGSITRLNETNDGLRIGTTLETISPDGSKLLFATDSTEELTGVDNRSLQLFIRDLATGEITPVSTSASGVFANIGIGAASFGGLQPNPFLAAFSPDGSKIAFVSNSSNLIDGETDSGISEDVFLKDLETGAVTRVSLSAGGVIPNGPSILQSFSPDGSKILFASQARNLIDFETDGNFSVDLFLYDIATGDVERISTSSAGAEADQASIAGSFVLGGSAIVFNSTARNLLDDFPETALTADIFVKDLETGLVTRISDPAPVDGEQPLGSSVILDVADDGTKVLFASNNPNLVPDDDPSPFRERLFVHDLQTGETAQVNTSSNGVQDDGVVTAASLSPDSNAVIFTSSGSNLIDGDIDNNAGQPLSTDVYVKFLETGQTIRASARADGSESDGASGLQVGFTQTVPRLLPGNEFAVFHTTSTNIFGTPIDPNGQPDIALKNLVTGEVTRLSQSNAGEAAVLGAGGDLMISPDGAEVFFTSNSPNLTPGSGFSDFFRVDLDATVSPIGGDTLDGGGGRDTLLGGEGDDLLIGGGGGDLLNGGGGIDTVSYETAGARVQMDLLGVIRGLGHAASDVFENVENVIGTRFNDSLRGDNGDNVIEGGRASDRLFGRAGDDTLDGGVGTDVLYGNAGADVMTGGLGADRYIYFQYSDSRVGASVRDVITDFVSGQDRIELSRLDADLTRGGNQTFEFIGGASFSGTAGELRFFQSAGANRTIVQADADGDGDQDFQIELTGLVSLDDGDFVL